MDSQFVEKIVHEVKSQGVFDEFRKSSMADVDTKPAYQNLRQRVENTVKKFLSEQKWTPETNKIQLREKLRRHITESGFLDVGVERIVDQVVNPKIGSVFQPKIEEIAYKYLGIPPPKSKPEPPPLIHSLPPLPPLHNGSALKLDTKVASLLPTDLEQVSPDSDRCTVKSECKDEPIDMDIDEKEDEDDESPPFEPLHKCLSPRKEEVMSDPENDIHRIPTPPPPGTETSLSAITNHADSEKEASISLDAIASDSQMSLASRDFTVKQMAAKVEAVEKTDVNISEEAQMPKFSENSNDVNVSQPASDLHFDIKKDEIKFEGTERRTSLLEENIKREANSDSLNDTMKTKNESDLVEDNKFLEMKANVQNEPVEQDSKYASSLDSVELNGKSKMKVELNGKALPVATETTSNLTTAATQQRDKSERSRHSSSSSSRHKKHSKDSKDRQRSGEGDRDRHRSRDKSKKKDKSKDENRDRDRVKHRESEKRNREDEHSKDSKYNSNSKSSHKSSKHSSSVRKSESDAKDKKTLAKQLTSSSSCSSTRSDNHDDGKREKHENSKKRSSSSSNKDRRERNHSSKKDERKTETPLDDHSESKKKSSRRKSTDSNDDDKDSNRPSGSNLSRSSSYQSSVTMKDSSKPSSKDDKKRQSKSQESLNDDTDKADNVNDNKTSQKYRDKVVILNDILENPSTKFICFDANAEENHIKVVTSKAVATPNTLSDDDELFFFDESSNISGERLKAIDNAINGLQEVVDKLRNDGNPKECKEDSIHQSTAKLQATCSALHVECSHFDETRPASEGANMSCCSERKRFKYEDSPTTKISPTPSDISMNSKENETFVKASVVTSKPSASGNKNLTTSKLSQQRYNSEDLYKPRPVLSQRSRRRRMESVI